MENIITIEEIEEMNSIITEIGDLIVTENS